MTSSENIKFERYKIEKEQNWRADIESIPWIKFPSEWQVKIIPPFGDAVVRFLVKLPNGLEKSVYLDSRMSLGYCSNPYWEVYPYENDVGRCDRSDIEALLRMVGSLN